jgi:hypothetical protein
MTVTDSHSALHSADEEMKTRMGHPNASVRAPARESHESTAQSDPQSAVTDSDQYWDLWAWIKDWITPPSIWTDGSDPLEAEWAYACRGEWTSKDGIPRTAGQAYALLVAMPVLAVAEYLKWIVKRPSRLAAGVVLLFILAQFPPVSWLI